MPSRGAPISDASPLIFLARANELSLLRVIAETVLVPRAVAQVIERLLDCGMYLSRQVIDTALALVGE